MLNNPIIIMEITLGYSSFLVFLLLLCICSNLHGCMDGEREALLLIKASINSPQGTAFSSWYGEDCCQWEGIQCNASTTRVSSIIFHNRRDPSLLENWYPNASLFAQFKDLNILQLPGNRIEGFTSPDEFHNLKQLQQLDLHDNSLENASRFCWGKGALPSLYHLDLSGNSLTGFVPECLCDSLLLKELNLYHNNLQGYISPCLSNMTSLQSLDLSQNRFIDSLPSFPFHNLSRIESMILSSNQFRGKFSFSIFANLSRLSQLNISYNPLIELETESRAWFPSINLIVLSLAGCNLRKIPTFLSTQNKLEYLDLSDNFLEGNVPSWLIGNSTLQLSVRGNNLSGPFPKTFGNISSRITSLDISNNSLHGPLLEDIHLIFPELLYLLASENGFSGSIPPSFGRTKRLRYLDLSNNKLHGEIPYLLTSNMSSLEHLYLQHNNLGGHAFPGNSSLPELKLVDLSHNDFTGIFLDSLSWSLSQSPALPQLRILILNGNLLEGKIPHQLCQMRHLQILVISGNNLSGDIPDCFDNITSWTTTTTTEGLLTYLDLSSNRLTGSFPDQITQLKAIVALNMSHNLITGQIPVSIGNLEAVEALDLSHNRLSGELCHELTALELLSVFSVSFNNLSGAVPPAEGQFATFDESSYRGNPHLCGTPLSKQCSLDLEKPPPPHTMSSQIRPSPPPTVCSFLVLFFFLV